MSDKFQPLSFGPRIRLMPKDELEGKPEHRERESRRGFKLRFDHPDGSFQPTKNLESEEIEMNPEDRARKIAEIEETVKKFRAEDPEGAARAESEALAWVAEHREREFPFETAVAKLRAGGASLTDAIRHAAAANPSDHDDYLRRAAEGKARDLR